MHPNSTQQSGGAEPDGDPTIQVAAVGQAGSAGKTTAVVSLACALAARGYTVEIGDMDGQGNASVALGITEPQYVVSDVLAKRVLTENDGTTRPITLNDIRVPVLDEWYYQYLIENPLDKDQSPAKRGCGVTLDPRLRSSKVAAEWLRRIQIYPAGGANAGQQWYDDLQKLSTEPFAGSNLKRYIGACTSQPHFRLWDSHGTKTIATTEVLYAVDFVFTSVTPDDKTMGRDLDHYFETVEELKVHNPTLKNLGFLIDRVGRKGQHDRMQIDKVRRRYPEHAGPEIREATAVREAYTEREPLRLYVPTHAVTKDYDTGLDWLHSRGLPKPELPAAA